ncbi:hypothetical protein V7127_03085 [Bacillus sp. JJ1773]|uniref:hypothetical protein n=1 Tax=Bacillus sp. JJ1773 TaxID=3122965 RepID=UPI002FFEA218
MKNFLFRSLIIVFLLSLAGCQQNTANKDEDGFVEPESSDWVKYIKPVREYIFHRTQAVINNDIHILWRMYPDLKDHIDREQGVNVEKYEVESLNEGFDLLDANYHIENHERMKVKPINEDEVIVLVHGSIVYLRDDFEESGGELLLKVFLKQINHQWTVVKTDEYTTHEYKEWLQEKEKR